MNAVALRLCRRFGSHWFSRYGFYDERRRGEQGTASTKVVGSDSAQSCVSLPPMLLCAHTVRFCFLPKLKTYCESPILRISCARDVSSAAGIGSRRRWEASLCNDVPVRQQAASSRISKHCMCHLGRMQRFQTRRFHCVMMQTRLEPLPGRLRSSSPLVGRLSSTCASVCARHMKLWRVSQRVMSTGGGNESGPAGSGGWLQERLSGFWKILAVLVLLSVYLSFISCHEVHTRLYSMCVLVRACAIRLSDFRRQ